MSIKEAAETLSDPAWEQFLVDHRKRRLQEYPKAQRPREISKIEGEIANHRKLRKQVRG